mgnify:CR=1 FL=1
MAKKNRGQYSKKQLAETPTLLYPDIEARWQDVQEPAETFNVTTDPARWAAELVAVLPDDTLQEVLPPDEVLAVLGDDCVDGYMWTPTALLDGVTLTAKGLGVNDISEFIGVADHLRQIGKKVYLYCVHDIHTYSDEWSLKVRYATVPC